MKSFRLRFNTFKAKKALKKKFEEFLHSEQWKKEAAEIAIKQIQGKTRLGKYIADETALPELSASTVKARKKYTGEKGTSFRATKSNLTMSGQLLKSIQRTHHKTQVIVEPQGGRTPYKGQKSTPPTNKKLTEYLSDKGFHYLGHDEKMKKLIKTKLLRHIRRHLLGKKR